MIHRNTPELLKMRAELENKISTLNSAIINVKSQISTVLNNINELIGVDVSDLVHKSDLNPYLTKE
jgi:hypothetical protein